MPATPRIAVVGAGIVGACIALHLAWRGAAVTLIDRGAPAGGVTGQAFAWINVAHGQPQPLMQLRHLAVHEWRRMQQDVGDTLVVDWCGGLRWTEDPAESERLAREHLAWGYDVRLLDRRAVAAREPNLVAPPEVAAFCPMEGAVDPVAATGAIVAAARRAGADVRLGQEVAGLAGKGSRATGVVTAEGTIEADVVVLAAGTGSPALAAGLGASLPVEPSPSVLLRLHAPRRLVHSIITCPVMEVRDGGPGLLLAAEDPVPGLDPQAIASRALAAIRAALHGAGDLAVASAETGQRPMPADEMPIMGFTAQAEGLYVAAMHAGITLGPTMGRLAATEILDDVEVAMLDSLRPGRFAAA